MAENNITNVINVTDKNTDAEIKIKIKVDDSELMRVLKILNSIQNVSIKIGNPIIIILSMVFGFLAGISGSVFI